MSIAAALYSSASVDWSTPQHVFDDLHKEFGFQLDVAASAENAKCAFYFTPEEDGLAQPWAPHVCFCNPPYGRVTGAWVAKARLESMRGALVVMLLPARTDTKWFHDHVLGHAEIRFLKGRLRFGGSENSAPFPSMVVVFRGLGVRT